MKRTGEDLKREYIQLHKRLAELGLLPDRVTFDQLPDDMIKLILSQLEFQELLTFHGYYSLKTSTRVRLLIDEIFRERIFQTLGDAKT